MPAEVLTLALSVNVYELAGSPLATQRPPADGRAAHLRLIDVNAPSPLGLPATPVIVVLPRMVS